MAIYAPLRDAFNDLNKMMLDKQEWDAKRESENRRSEREHLVLQSQLEDAALRRKSLEREAQRNQDAMREVEINIFDVIPQNEYSQRKVFDDSNAAAKFASLVGGSQINRANGRVLDMNGEPLRLPKGIAMDRMASAFGAISSVFDPEEMINENLSVINSKLTDYESQLNKVPVGDVSKRKDLLQRISEVKTEKNKHSKLLEPEELIPYYRQRMQHVENLILTVASGGGDPTILQALQGTAQRLNSDYLSVVQRKMQMDQKKLEIQFRKEDRAAQSATEIEKKRMELAAKKEEAELKEKTPTSKFAIQLDKDGNIINAVQLNVPKNKPSFTIEEVDPRLKASEGWRFSDVSELLDKMQKSTKLNAIGSNNILYDMFKLPDDKGLIGPNVPDANVPRYHAALSRLGEYIKTEPNETKAASKAFEEIKNAEIYYWEKLAEDIRDAGLTNPKAIEAYESKLADEFAKDYGYRPNRANIDSLRRMVGVKLE